MNTKTKYYIIKQSIPCLIPNVIKINFPCNLFHLKKLISFMFGKIEVFLYNDFDNSRIDLSSKLGFLNFNIFDYPNFNTIFKISLVYSHFILKDKFFTFYAFYTDRLNKDLPKFFIYGDVFKFKNVTLLTNGFFLSSIEDHYKKISYGNTYETFISKKYQEQDYQVELNGIKKSFEDGGIDIIAIKENSIVLVQCKNWAMSNNYKITQKDLRAFVGDCFLYLKDKPLDKKISYHFIVSHENILTGSAKIFLEKHKFIKFKCVPFEK